MIIGVYSMRDIVSGQFNTPTFEVNDAYAVRSFRYAINNNNFYKYLPADFDLFKIGEFDTEKGSIKPMDPTMLVSGLSVIERNTDEFSQQVHKD